ncbi:hypothetical protein HDU76_000830 [Blyttiomyces sp. JEL0837]|nr:hypothetical protein HDU76_000830 [Blyttiomyces sp. JEL0837]
MAQSMRNNDNEVSPLTKSSSSLMDATLTNSSSPRTSTTMKRKLSQLSTYSHSSSPASDWIHLYDVQSGIIANPSQGWHRSFGGSKTLVSRLEVQSKPLVGHAGCLNTLAWNESGTRLISGSDDCCINVWNPYASENGEALVHKFVTGHTSNIFSAKFMTGSNDQKIVSCAANGQVRYMEVNAEGSRTKVKSDNAFLCHTSVNYTYEVLPDPGNPSLFFSCADDGTVNQYDIRIRTSCDCEGCTLHTLIDINRSKTSPRSCRSLSKSLPSDSSSNSSSRAHLSATSRRLMRMFGTSSDGLSVSAISLHPLESYYMALACSDDVVRIYDRRQVKSPGWGWGSNEEDQASAGEVYSFRPGSFGHAGYGEEEEEEEDQREEEDGGGEHGEDDDDEEGTDIILRLFGSRPIRLRRGETTQSDGRKRQKRQPRPQYKKITAMKFEPVFGREILISYAGDEIMLISPNEGKGIVGANLGDVEVKTFLQSPDSRDGDLVGIFKGHQNERTMIKEAYFYGPQSEYVMSGSDDGTLWIWDKATGKVVNRLKGDRHVVNCVCPNPYDSTLAVSGIDHSIKMILPTSDQPWKDGVTKMKLAATTSGTSPESAGITDDDEEGEDDDDDDDDNEEDEEGGEEGHPRRRRQTFASARDLLLWYFARANFEMELSPRPGGGEGEGDGDGDGGGDSEGSEHAAEPQE